MRGSVSRCAKSPKSPPRAPPGALIAEALTGRSPRRHNRGRPISIPPAPAWHQAPGRLRPWSRDSTKLILEPPPALRPCISCRACSCHSAMTASTPGASASPVDPPNGPAPPLVGATPLPFPQLCASIHTRVAALLDQKDAPSRVKSLQDQTRTSLEVIEKALDQYKYVETVPFVATWSCSPANRQTLDFQNSR
jgi:hypothetical protein